MSTEMQSILYSNRHKIISTWFNKLHRDRHSKEDRVTTSSLVESTEIYNIRISEVSIITTFVVVLPAGFLCPAMLISQQHC